MQDMQDPFGTNIRNRIPIISLETKRIKWIDVPTCYQGVYGNVSPDGKWLVFDAFTTEKKSKVICMVDLETGQIKEVYEGTVKIVPAWSSDSKRIAFGSGGHKKDYPLLILDINTGKITDTGKKGVGIDWSSDGTSIVYTGNFPRGSSWSNFPTDGSIVKTNLKTGLDEVLTDTPVNVYNKETENWKLSGAYSPKYSPNGKKILYFSNYFIWEKPEYEWERHEWGYKERKEGIWIMNNDGAGKKMIFPNLNYNELIYCIWGPGSDKVFIQNRNEILAIDINTLQKEEIAKWETPKVPESKLPQAVTTALAETTFDQLWEAFDRKYAMFVLRPEVDWAKLREQYRPKALASKSTYEFADVCANMLKNLRDLHVRLTVADVNVPVYSRPRSKNANPRAYQTILGGCKQKASVVWVVTANKIGFIAISGWDDSKITSECDEALEQMRDTRGLIVDVRLNGGGSEPLAEQFAGRFLEKEFVYAYSQFRNGPNHTNLTEKYERKVAPRGPWRYNRPVILLIGQKCMSSNESFIGMMTGDPEVTTMGDHTCGSSGNPDIVHLPLDITVSIPQWIDYLPDGTPLDEHGFKPQIPFKPTPDAFEGDRDDLLTAALARLNQAPLPNKPIENPAFKRSTTDLP